MGYKSGSLTKVGVERRNVGIFFFEKFIKNPIFRLLGDPKKTGKKCCGESLTDTRKKTSNCTICDETLHNQCRGPSGECKNGCKKTFIFKQQKKADISEIPELIKQWPKWEIAPEPEKEKEKENLKKTMRREKKAEQKVVKQTKKVDTGSCGIFKDDKGGQQPKITDKFGKYKKILDAEPPEGKEFFDGEDSHKK